MTTPALFKEYIWLVNTIYQARKITLREINRRWIQTEMSGGVELARSTFNRHKDAIEDIFGIYIDCDRKNGYQYYIGNEDALREDSVQKWMLSTLSVNNLISESLGLQSRILLESAPSADERMEQIISSMKKGRLLEITYQKYSAAECKVYVVAPYCIKLYRRRWYLLARFNTGFFSVFSFDRIKQLSVTDDPFTLDADFNADQYFSECYGVVRGDEAPERIIIRAYGTERNYLKDLPLHHSQREVAVGDGYTDFELFLHPTLDLQGQILSRGNRLKVLSPQSLVDKIKDALQEAAQLYL